ncbi:putative uncharacterized protein [Prevotella sp. CAG:604]|nr:hypothetical protein [uncultured Prevotella sp.]CDA53492.1 putative uncharacterized protein [Prevotella sp. CAG:604]
MKNLLITLLLLVCSYSVQAQTNDLTQEQIESFKTRCEETIEAFQYGLEIIGDKSQDKAVKQHYKQNILSFFMGDGRPYQDLDGNMHPAVKMEISTLRYSNVINKRTLKLTEYLENLENLKYVEVKIQKAQTCIISNLYKVGDRYEGTVSIFQYFTGRTKDNIIYRDRTQKDIKIYVDKVKDGTLGEFWQLKLGDVNVVETVKL